MASVKAKGAGAGRPKAAPQYVLVQPIIVTQEDWVQCENPKCEKWRRLPAGHPPIDPDAPWCALAPPPTAAFSTAFPNCTALPSCRCAAAFRLRRARRVQCHAGFISAGRRFTPSPPLRHRYCNMSPDPLRNSCDAPEEVQSVPQPLPEGQTQ